MLLDTETARLGSEDHSRLLGQENLHKALLACCLEVCACACVCGTMVTGTHEVMGNRFFFAKPVWHVHRPNASGED